MLSTSFNSQFVLLGSVSATNNQSSHFGQNIQWLGNDLFSVASNLVSPVLSEQINFSDGTIFDGNNTEFSNIVKADNQQLTVFQVLKTNRSWISSNADILNPVTVSTISLTGTESPDIVYSGAIDNLFIADTNNPNEAIKIYNNPTLTPGWVVSTAQEPRLDPNSILQAWIYDSITRVKLADLEIVDLYSGILPGTIASDLDYISDIDPATYSIPNWGPSINYNINDRVLYNGIIYEALYSGKSGNIFNTLLWKLISTQNNNVNGLTTWGTPQVGKTWFDTSKLRVINAQLGTLDQRAQNWNQWFPKSNIVVYEWVVSSLSPSNYTSSEANGTVTDPNISYSYDKNTGLFGFWVSNKNSLNSLHNQTAQQLSEAISNIPNSGIPMISAIDNNAVAIWNVNQFISSNSVILHVDYILKNANNNLHNEFALISNDGTKSWYNTSIYPKFIDSLCGVSVKNQLVPDLNIPNSQQVGILNNPIQSLFANRINALEIYYNIINNQLANVAVATSAVISALSEYDPLPNNGFDEQIANREILNELNISNFPENYRILITNDSALNPAAWSIVAVNNREWKIVQHQLYNLNNNWEYADWYSTKFINDSPTYILNNAGELSLISFVTGDIIQINNNGNNNKVIYLAVTNNIDNNVTELDPIYIQNGTIQFLPNLYNFAEAGIGFDAAPFDTENFDNDPYIEIRLITELLNNEIFVGSQDLLGAADAAFYAIIKYILYENENLDWLFKTSFITVDYANRTLNVQGNYTADNQSVIEDFISESTPFHTRVREFRNIYAEYDFGNVGIVDFDLPAQYDKNYANLVLSTTNNPKMSSIMQTSVFKSNTGVYYDTDSFYITSNGLPVNNSTNLNAIVNSYSFGIPRTQINSSIQFDVPTENTGFFGVAVDGVPLSSSNSGIIDTLYYTANLNIQQSYTKNNLFISQKAGVSGNVSIFANNINTSYLLTADGNLSESSSWNYVPSYSTANLTPANISVLSTDYQWLFGDFSYVPGYLPIPGFTLTDKLSNKATICFGTSGNLLVDPNSKIYGSTKNLAGGFGSNAYIISQGFGGFDSESNAVSWDEFIENTGNTIISLISINLQETPGSFNQLLISNININNEIFSPSIDPWFGYVNSNNQYSYSSIPFKLINNLNNSHSPLIGFAWDGVPIYGPIGFKDNIGSGELIYQTSSWKLKSALRLEPTGELINGLQIATYQKPNGRYIEDFEYIQNLGTLDYNNGRFCTTPEFPNGTYAYFVPFDDSENVAVYPYLIGPAYYGQPFNLNYIYVNGINTAIFPNGNIKIPTGSVYTNLDAVRSPDGTQTSDSTTLQEPIYSAWYNNYQLSNNQVRKINTTLRFDRISPTIEVITANTLYPINSVVYNTENLQFITAITNNANSSSISNIFQWSNANINSIDISTAMNRIMASYNPGNNLFANQAKLLMAGTEYPGVFVNAEEFVLSYAVPSGSIFNYDDPNANLTALNLSWRPGQLSDTALTSSTARFGKTSGVFDASIGQYLTVNIASPNISDISIGSNSFTLEFFVNFSNIAANDNISVFVDTRKNISTASPAIQSGLVISYENGSIKYGANTNLSLISSDAINFTANVWHYIALNSSVYANGNITSFNTSLYMDGQLLGINDSNYNYTDDSITFGADISGNNVMTGYMDEIRLTVNHNRYIVPLVSIANTTYFQATPLININVPVEPFTRSSILDEYTIPEYTPILWGFENFVSESNPGIKFDSINSQTLISDLSWNQKKLILINYGANNIINSNTLNNINAPEDSQILSIKLNQGE